MNQRLVSGAIGTVLFAGMCVFTNTQPTSGAPVTRPVSAIQDEASTYKFTEGGVQFTVPAGWAVKPDSDGAVN